MTKGHTKKKTSDGMIKNKKKQKKSALFTASGILFFIIQAVSALLDHSFTHFIVDDMLAIGFGIFGAVAGKLFGVASLFVKTLFKLVIGALFLGVSALAEKIYHMKAGKQTL